MKPKPKRHSLAGPRGRRNELGWAGEGGGLNRQIDRLSSQEMEGTCSCLDAPRGVRRQGWQLCPSRSAAPRDILVKTFGSTISHNKNGRRPMVNLVLPTSDHGCSLGGPVCLDRVLEGMCTEVLTLFLLGGLWGNRRTEF